MATSFSTDGQQLFTGNWGTLYRCDVATGTMAGPALVPPGEVVGEGDIGAIVPFDDGARLALAWHASGRVVVDANALRVVLQTPSHGDEVQRLARSPDGRILASGGNNHRATAEGRCARLWDAISGQPVGELMRHQGPVLGLAFRPDGRYLLTGSHDGTVRLWDAATGQPRGGRPERLAGEVWTVDYAPNGRLILTAGSARTVQLWDRTTWQQVGTSMPHEGTIQFARFNPQGELLAAVGADQAARLWHVHSCKPVGPALRHEGLVANVAWSRDGKHLSTGGMDSTARLWSVPSPATGSAAAVLDRVRSLTGMDLDDKGLFTVLDASAWNRLPPRSND
jgi:WD40 repeat protein